MSLLRVYKDRTNVTQILLGVDYSGDTFESQIRKEENIDSDLIATWGITKDVYYAEADEDEEFPLTKLILRLDNSVLTDIDVVTAYMDIKRISGGEPYQVFSKLIIVLFADTVTA